MILLFIRRFKAIASGSCFKNI